VVCLFDARQSAVVLRNEGKKVITAVRPTPAAKIANFQVGLMFIVL
jgi:hypothetical protein